VADSEEEQRDRGIRFSACLATDVLAGGASGLHLYTFNRHEPVLQVLGACGLVDTASPATSTDRTTSTDRKTSTDGNRPADHRPGSPNGADEHAGVPLKEIV
jgi:hypothetical protein